MACKLKPCFVIRNKGSSGTSMCFQIAHGSFYMFLAERVLNQMGGKIGGCWSGWIRWNLNQNVWIIYFIRGKIVVVKVSYVKVCNSKSILREQLSCNSEDWIQGTKILKALCVEAVCPHAGCKNSRIMTAKNQNIFNATMVREDLYKQNYNDNFLYIFVKWEM